MNNKIIAVDFDGTLCDHEYPNIGKAHEDVLDYVKAEKANGAKVILWTCRIDEKLTEAVNWCKEQGLELDAVNENLPDVIEAYGGDTRKILANEYIDDLNNPRFTACKDMGEVSDGYHTFNSLYRQRLFLFAALVNAFPDRSWKSHKHSDGEAPFGGGWFIVGIDTPTGPYTYHYEDKDWSMFACKEVETAPEWDGHTDENVDRVLSLIAAPILEEGTVSSWAADEVKLAIEAEKNASPGTDEWEYGAECYKSALRALQSLTKDGHSGFSIQITKSILNRLIDGRPLTPIEDMDDIWKDITLNSDGEPVFGDGKKHYQCKRMSALFKEVSEDGTVTYSDVERVNAADINNPNAVYKNSFTTRLIDKIFPITMPYLPANKKFTVMTESFLVDPKNGDWDTEAYLYILTPEGKRIELNRYFKDEDGKMVQIEKAEYDERKAKKVEKK